MIGMIFRLGAIGMFYWGIFTEEWHRAMLAVLLWEIARGFLVSTTVWLSDIGRDRSDR